MNPGTATEHQADVHARKIGGIDETSVSLRPGVNVLSGRNATNRTSFLRAIMAAMGSDDVSLKGDADRGEVTLTLDGETYTRTLARENGGVTSGGDPYLEDPTLADLFAFLLETNEARRTVELGGDLRDLVMRPVDTEEIEGEIERLGAERREIEEKIEELDAASDRLPALEAERTRLEEEIEEKRAALVEKEAELESADADVEETRDDEDALEARLDDLQALRSDLEDVRFRMESNRESLEALREERSELDDELAALPSVADADRRGFDDEIARLRERKQSLESTITDLRRIVQFNRRQIDDELGSALDGTRAGRAEGAVTDRLLDDEDVVCWTCGSEVDPDAIESTLETLRGLSEEKAEERNGVEREIEELRAKHEELETHQQHRDRLRQKLADVDAGIENRQRRSDELRSRKGELSARLEALEASVDELRRHDYGEILDLHREANRLGFELNRLEDRRDEAVAEIESLETRLEERSALRGRRAEIREERSDLRTRVEQVESAVVEEFNEHMEAVLSLLGYENIERIWLERRRREVREGRRKVEKPSFDLHVVRSTPDGTTYEDRLVHLSESEREVTGLVFALAGYLVHDVHETVPFMLLDSLEAIDSERIGELVDYMGEFSDYLVVALLPEDTRAVSGEHRIVTEL